MCRKIIQKLLSSQGHEVVLAENGQIAMRTFLASPGAFDLVLMDINMPVMDGVTAARGITDAVRNGGLRNVPIVALSASCSAEEKGNCRVAGMVR